MGGRHSSSGAGDSPSGGWRGSLAQRAGGGGWPRMRREGGRRARRRSRHLARTPVLPRRLEPRRYKSGGTVPRPGCHGRRSQRRDQRLLGDRPCRKPPGAKVVGGRGDRGSIAAVRSPRNRPCGHAARTPGIGSTPPPDSATHDRRADRASEPASVQGSRGAVSHPANVAMRGARGVSDAFGRAVAEQVAAAAEIKEGMDPTEPPLGPLHRATIRPRRGT